MTADAAIHPCEPRLWREAQALPRNNRKQNLVAVDEAMGSLGGDLTQRDE